MNYIHLPESTAKRIMEYLKQRPLNEPQFIADVGGLAVAISNAKPLPKKPGPKGKHKDPLCGPECIMQEREDYVYNKMLNESKNIKG